MLIPVVMYQRSVMDMQMVLKFTQEKLCPRKSLMLTNSIKFIYYHINLFS